MTPFRTNIIACISFFSKDRDLAEGLCQGNNLCGRFEAKLAR